MLILVKNNKIDFEEKKHRFDKDSQVIKQLAWPKSTLLLKIDAHNTAIYIKTKCSKSKYRIYSRISREVLDKNGPTFFQFDLYAGR